MISMIERLNIFLLYLLYLFLCSEAFVGASGPGAIVTRDLDEANACISCNKCVYLYSKNEYVMAMNINSSPVITGES